jgi:hypothetical protein
MTIVAILNVVYGGLVAVGNTYEVVRGETFDGLVVTPPTAALGLAGAAFAALLFLGGIGTWQLRSCGRKLSLGGAAETFVVNGMPLAVAVMGFPIRHSLVGVVYPALLLILYNLPRWKAAFAGSRSASAT